jgi:hypothetical protein
MHHLLPSLLYNSLNYIFVDLQVCVQNDDLFFRIIIDLLKHIIFIGKS